MQMTAKSSVDSVRREMIANMRIPLPSIQNQKEISESLREIELEIISLEKKLSKALQIKQGMMQELLTGKIRLV
jgi:type I restriction enzyme S subunit